MKTLRIVVKVAHTVLYFGSIVLPVLDGAHRAVCALDSTLTQPKRRKGDY